MSSALLHLSPDAALLVLTLGILLIYVELNRPGSILPGALGLAAVLLSVAVFAHSQPKTWPVALILVSIATFLRGLRRDTSAVFYSLATLLLAIGFLRLIPANTDPHIHAYTAVPCAILLGFLTGILSRIARRARRNKGLD